MKRLDINYAWHGDETLYAKRLSYVKRDDLVVITGSYNGIGGLDHPFNEPIREHAHKIQQIGARPFGYINTRAPLPDGTYGAKGTLPLNDFYDQIVNWSLHGVDAIFADDWPAAWGTRILGACWSMCRGYLRPDKPVFIANAGGNIVYKSDIPSSALLVTHENGFMPPPDYVPHRWEAAIVHHSTAPRFMYDQLDNLGWSYGFVTKDGNDGNPYDGDPGA